MHSLTLAPADGFYKNRTANGTRQYWPVQALETYWCDWPLSSSCCVNDMPTISGVTSVLQKLLLLPDPFTNATQRAKWAAMLAIQPPMPTSKDGSILEPAEVAITPLHNSEPPELFSVHPHRMHTLGQARTHNASLVPAINAFRNDPLAHSSNTGWNYGVCMCARDI